MEIPAIAQMSDFNAGILSFAATNTSTIIRLLGFSTFKWGALILAVIYAFGRIARRIKIFVLQRHRRPKSGLDDDDVSSDEGEEDEEEDENEEYSRESCSSEDEVRDESRGGFFEEFCVAGRKRKFSIRRRRSAGPTDDFKPSTWDNSHLDNSTTIFTGEFFEGNGVVKLWDGLGLDVGFGCSEESISVMDLDRNLVVGSIIGGSPVVSPSSPRVVVAASGSGDGKVGVRSWDMRLRRRTPAMAAEWRFDGAAEVAAAGERVYVRDGVTGNVTVGDLRKTNSPLVGVTEYYGDGWFGADSVREMVEERTGR